MDLHVTFSEIVEMPKSVPRSIKLQQDRPRWYQDSDSTNRRCQESTHLVFWKFSSVRFGALLPERWTERERGVRFGSVRRSHVFGFRVLPYMVRLLPYKVIRSGSQWFARTQTPCLVWFGLAFGTVLHWTFRTLLLWTPLPQQQTNPLPPLDDQPRPTPWRCHRLLRRILFFSFSHIPHHSTMFYHAYSWTTPLHSTTFHSILLRLLMDTLVHSTLFRLAPSLSPSSISSTTYPVLEPQFDLLFSI